MKLSTSERRGTLMYNNTNSDNSISPRPDRVDKEMKLTLAIIIYLLLCLLSKFAVGEVQDEKEEK